MSFTIDNVEPAPSQAHQVDAALQAMNREVQSADDALLADKQRPGGDVVNVSNDAGDKKIQWQTDLTKAFQQAQAEHKPIILEIGATWCGFCKTMNDQVVGDPAFARQYADKAIFVKLDAENDEVGQQICKGFKVNEFPTFLVLDTSRGSLAETGRTVGYMDLSKFKTAINEYLPSISGRPVALAAGPDKNSAVNG